MPFIYTYLNFSQCFVGMTKPKVADGEISPWKNSKGITINEDATTSRGRVTKLPIMSGKTKGKEKAHASPEHF